MAKGGNTSTQTTANEPWGPAGDTLERVLRKGNKLFNQGSGFNAYPGEGYVPFSDESNQAMSQMTSMAKQGNPFYQGASNFTRGILGGDYAHDQSGFDSLFGRAGALTNGPSINTEGDYRGLLNSMDPEFENVVQNTANDLGDQISRQFGGANFGSAGHSDYLTKQVGDVVSRMRSDNFNQNLANKNSILGNISGVQGQNFANAMSGLGLQRGILGDQANLSQQDIQNMFGGLGAMDSVYQSQFLPAERLAAVGAAKEGKAGEKLQADMDKFAIEDMSDWDRLMNLFGIASGTGAQGGTAVQSVQQPSNPWSTILGGGMLASQLRF